MLTITLRKKIDGPWKELDLIKSIAPVNDFPGFVGGSAVGGIQEVDPTSSRANFFDIAFANNGDSTSTSTSTSTPSPSKKNYYGFDSSFSLTFPSTRPDLNALFPLGCNLKKSHSNSIDNVSYVERTELRVKHERKNFDCGRYLGDLYYNETEAGLEEGGGMEDPLLTIAKEAKIRVFKPLSTSSAPISLSGEERRILASVGHPSARKLPPRDETDPQISLIVSDGERRRKAKLFTLVDILFSFCYEKRICSEEEEEEEEEEVSERAL